MGVQAGGGTVGGEREGEIWGVVDREGGDMGEGGKERNRVREERREREWGA